MKSAPLLPGWLLLATIAAFAVAMCVTLGGCATGRDLHAWKHTRPASAKPWLYVTVDDPNVICRFLGSTDSHSVRIDACAIWKPAGCEMYLPAGAPRWLISHEERHCEGWTHE